MAERGRFDGNAEQVRAIAEDIAEAMERRLGDHLSPEKMDKRIDDRVSTALLLMETTINRRLILAAIAYAIPVIVAAFFLGGLWIRFQDVPQVLQGRGVWMAHIETRVRELEKLHERDGYEPPEKAEIPN